MNPQRKNALLIGVLLLVAAALGFYAYFGVMKPEEREAHRKEEAEKLVSLGEGEINFQSIVVTAKGEKTTLEKRDREWRVIFPAWAKGKADKFAVDQIINQLTTAKLKSAVEEKPVGADLVKYGVKPPKFSVTTLGFLGVRGDGGTRAQNIEIYGGIENPFDGSVYVRRGHDPAIYLTDGSLRSALEKSTFDLRDKEVLVQDESQIQSLYVKAKSTRYALQRESGEGWKLLEPKPTAEDREKFDSMIQAFLSGPTPELITSSADTEGANAIIAALKNNRALSFPMPGGPAPFDVETPAVDLLVVVANGEKARIRLGTVVADGGSSAYLLREQGTTKTLAEVPSTIVSALDKDPLSLRDKSVLRVSRQEVAKITFSSGGGAPEVVAIKSAVDGGETEDWEVVAPIKGPAKTWKVSSVLWGLTSLKASSIGEENPKDWNKYGLSQGAKAVSVFDSQGKPLGTLRIGSPVSRKPGVTYVRGTSNHVLEIESDKLTAIPFNAADLLDQPPHREIEGGHR